MRVKEGFLEEVIFKLIIIYQMGLSSKEGREMEGISIHKFIPLVNVSGVITM